MNERLSKIVFATPIPESISQGDPRRAGARAQDEGGISEGEAGKIRNRAEKEGGRGEESVEKAVERLSR